VRRARPATRHPDRINCDPDRCGRRQGSEIVENGKIKATWFVVPGSGTDDLSGLRGEGGFEGDFGKGSDATLDYWFE
jgi:hypothetical protein